MRGNREMGKRERYRERDSIEAADMKKNTLWKLDL